MDFATAFTVVVGMIFNAAALALLKSFMRAATGRRNASLSLSLFDASILITCVTGAKQFVVQEARSVAKLTIHAQNCFTSPFLGLTFFAPASICDAFF